MARKTMRWYHQLAGSVCYSQAGFDSGRAFGQERAGGKGGAGGTLEYVRGNYKSLKGTNLTVLARRHPFISPA